MSTKGNSNSASTAGQVLDAVDPLGPGVGDAQACGRPPACGPCRWRSRGRTAAPGRARSPARPARSRQGISAAMAPSAVGSTTRVGCSRTKSTTAAANAGDVGDEVRQHHVAGAVAGAERRGREAAVGTRRSTRPRPPAARPGPRLRTLARLCLTRRVQDQDVVAPGRGLPGLGHARGGRGRRGRFRHRQTRSIEGMALACRISSPEGGVQADIGDWTANALQREKRRIGTECTPKSPAPHGLSRPAGRRRPACRRRLTRRSLRTGGPGRGAGRPGG